MTGQLGTLLLLCILGLSSYTLATNQSLATNPEPRIIGGQPTLPNEFKHQVFVGARVGLGTQICSGSILNPNYILTAAHCVHGMPEKNILIYAGRHVLTDTRESTAQNLTVDRVIVHDCYDPDVVRRNFRNDIAIVKLKTRIVFNDFVQSIRIDERDRARPFREVQITGWGRTNATVPESFSHVLKKANLTVSGQGECEVDFSFLHISSQFCATSFTSFACQGDSGGSLLCKDNGIWYVCGITSFVSARGCTTAPSAYTRVSHFKDWINSVVRNGRNSTLNCVSGGSCFGIDLECIWIVLLLSILKGVVTISVSWRLK